MSRGMFRGLVAATLAGLALAAAAGVYLAAGVGPPNDAAPAGRPPHIHPDYGGATVPPNIAPLNFVIDEPGEAYHVRISGDGGKAVDVRSACGAIAIPPQAWRELLEANRGGRLRLEAFARGAGGAWTRFEALALEVAREDVDRYVLYRLLGPLYNKYLSMGIYQMDLAAAAETCVLDNRSFGRGCVNCHTTCWGDPSRMFLHIRGAKGLAMIVAQGSRASKVDTRTAWNPAPAAYSAWHPGGRLIAFSVNKLAIFFHSVGECRDVFDADSDLGVYDVETGTVTTAPAIANPDRVETWPAWSSDGRYLYFSSGPKLPKERFREVRYDLVRAAYDAGTGAWGRPETIVSAAESGRSVLEPRASPDGRWVLVSMCDYGNFPIYQASCDLYLVDPNTRRYRRLECNSDRCDSYHSWSSNSRWIVFSSKRGDGVFARPYLAYIDADGKARKPFVMPQRDPTHYDAYIKTYNAPEFARSPVAVPEREWARVISDPSPEENVKALLDPAVKARAPAKAAPPTPAEVSPEGVQGYAPGR